MACSGRSEATRCASAAAFGTLTGSSTTRTPAAVGQVESERQGLGRQVAVEHDQRRRRDQVPRGVDVLGRQLVGGGHVGDGDDELAVGVEHGRVGAGRAGGPPYLLDVHAGAGGRREHLVAQAVGADRGDEVGAGAEAGEVLGDVAAHAAGGHRRGARVAGRRDDGAAAARLDVHVGAADDDHGLLLAQDVAPAEDHALLAEVGQVHVDGGPGGAELPRQRGRPDQRVATQQRDDLLLAVGQAHACQHKPRLL